MSDPVRKRLAVAKTNREFISVQAYSMYRSAMADPNAPEHLLAPDANDETLGQAALDALQNSRFLSVDEATELRITLDERYEVWVEKMMREFGYAKRRELFRLMKSCDLELYNDVITIKPTNHHQLDGWNSAGIDPADHIRLAGDATAAEVGAALRLAFQRCIQR